MNRIVIVLLLALAGCEGRTEAVSADAGDASAGPAIATPAPAPAAPDAPDAPAGFELPGDFAEATTLAELQERFGPHDVLVVEAPQDDGGVRRSVVLFPDDPTRRAYVEFHDSEALAGIASISVRDRESVWRGKGGVHVGMAFAELRRANDWPFHFSGFDTEGRAWVRDQWSPAVDDSSRLGKLDVGADDHMYFGVDLGLKSPVAEIPPGDIPQDENVSSDDPAYPRLGELVEVTAIVASTSLDDEWQ